MSQRNLSMPHWPKPLGVEPQGTPSQRARVLLKKLGSPELKLPPVIHVGGTKGKGSTIAFLRAMLTAAGYKVHVYTTPHLERFNERIMLAGNNIDDATLYEVIEQVRLAAGDMPVGFFDATTAAAMLAFASYPADILLMEMGLGGVVDATNIIDNPLLTILTTISYDHMEFMGNSLQEIAEFEAGLFKPEVPCIVSYQPAKVLPVLERKAAETNSPLYTYGKHWLTKKSVQEMIFADSHGNAELPLPSLLGAHQIVNAGNAIAAISSMENFNVTEQHIVQGLLTAEWKGRLQKIDSQLLPANCELWFDGGHNIAAGQAVSLFASEHWRDKPLYLVFGTTEGKDVLSIVSPFLNIVKKIYGVKVQSEPKGYSAEAITNSLLSIANVTASESISDAIHDIAMHESQAFRILVFGSLYLWLDATANLNAG